MRNEIITKVKQVIKENYKYADCGIFFTRNLVGDSMKTVHENEDIQIDICYEWAYFEVFGLTEDEQEVIESYYRRLERSNS